LINKADIDAARGDRPLGAQPVNLAFPLRARAAKVLQQELCYLYRSAARKTVI